MCALLYYSVLSLMQFLSHCVQFFYFQQSYSWDSWCHWASFTNCLHHQRLKKAALLKQIKENLILKFWNFCKLLQIRFYPDGKHLKLAWFVHSPEQKGWNITGTLLENITDIGEVRCLHRPQRILKVNTHPSHSLSTLLPSGERYRRICCRTTRLQSSFFPQAVRLLNSSLTLQLWQFFLSRIKKQNSGLQV